MFAAKSVARVAPALRGAMQVRNMTAVSAPPAVRISFGEKVAHGLVMTASFMFIPTWVLLNIRSYRGLE